MLLHDMRPYYCNFVIILLCLCLTTDTTLSKHGKDEKKCCIDIHNEARTAVGLQKLEWNTTLSQYAKWYANQRRADCALTHSSGPYGENIFWGSGNYWSLAQAAEDWVGERQAYNHTNNSCAPGKQCGHYTQIVWRDTQRIGCAKVRCVGGQGVFMACNYDPPGNYVGESPY